MNAYIFDVDGVFTNPVEKTVSPEILQALVKLFEEGNIIAFNSGRSVTWIEDNIMSPLLPLVSTTDLFKNFIAIGEMGTTTLVFKDGWKKYADQLVIIPKDLKEKIREIVESQFHESMKLDETKETMISVEIQDGYDSKKYLLEQKRFVYEVEKILSSEKYQKLHLTYGSNVAAVDIHHKDAGKHFGAKQIEKWIQENTFTIETITMFGDNPSDLAMAEELEHLYPVTFVFVSDPEKLEGKHPSFKIIHTKNRYDKGTLEYLSSHS